MATRCCELGLGAERMGCQSRAQSKTRACVCGVISAERTSSNEGSWKQYKATFYNKKKENSIKNNNNTTAHKKIINNNTTQQQNKKYQQNN